MKVRSRQKIKCSIEHYPNYSEHLFSYKINAYHKIVNYWRPISKFHKQGFLRDTINDLYLISFIEIVIPTILQQNTKKRQCPKEWVYFIGEDLPTLFCPSKKLTTMPKKIPFNSICDDGISLLLNSENKLEVLFNYLENRICLITQIFSGLWQQFWVLLGPLSNLFTMT